MVTVVGSGVSGLTTAVALRRAGVEAEVLTDRPPDQLVSWVAGAVWSFTDLAGTQPEAGWALRTREVLADLAARPSTGVTPLFHRRVFRDDPGAVWWEHTPWVERVEPPPGYAVALGVDGFVIDPPTYLGWLRAELESLGGSVATRHVDSLGELAGDVVNATGLGARELVSDDELYPVRGQVVAVRAPLVRDGVADEADGVRVAYVYPRPDQIVLGGTRQVGDADLAPDPVETRRILAETAALEPALDGATVLEERVGLRPGRDRVRLELELDGDRRIVHNYGHGGHGYLLSWGCAERAVELVAAEARGRSDGARPSRVVPRPDIER